MGIIIQQNILPYNLLNDPGNQDITSFVNFKRFKEISYKNNLNFYGPFTQRSFLMTNGIEDRKKKIILKANEKQKKMIEKGYFRLTSRKEMGDIFKCIIVSSFNINHGFK